MNEILQNLPDDFNPEIIKQLLKDRKALIAATQRDFFLFFYTYFGRHIRDPIAPFHFKMFKIVQDEKIKRAGVMTFRNSGKSTILNTAYALWAIMGIHRNKHIVIASQTQQRAKDHLMNIRKEIENNQLLKENLGPFSLGEDRWGATTLIIPKYEARISAISVEEGIRGLKEGPYRPEVIIADDIEDSNSVKNQDIRDKTYDWFSGELIPLGETNVKVIVLGNFLHQDSILSRLEKKITKGEMEGVFLRVPLVDEKNVITWPGKFRSLEEIEKFRKGIGNDRTWQRDFLLLEVPDQYQVVHPEWIHYYDELPDMKDEKNEYRFSVVAVDPAISETNKADFTAAISARVFYRGENIKIYILPYPLNERLSFPKSLEKIKEISKSLGDGLPTEIYIEEAGYQASLTQLLEQDLYPAKGFSTRGQDKRSRLNLITPFLKARIVLFPRKGAELLIRQLKDFGVEKHDDLVDALTLLVGEVMRENGGKCSPFPEQGPKVRKGMKFIDLAGYEEVEITEDDGKGRPFTAGLLDKKF